MVKPEKTWSGLIYKSNELAIGWALIGKQKAPAGSNEYIIKGSLGAIFFSSLYPGLAVGAPSEKARGQWAYCKLPF